MVVSGGRTIRRMDLSGMVMIVVAIVLVTGDVCFGQNYWKRVIASEEQKQYHINQIIPTADGNFLFSGFHTVGTSDPGAWLLKINPNGDELWEKFYAFGNGIDDIRTVLPTTDGNFLLAGRVIFQGRIVKINQTGDTLWAKTYRGAGFSYFYTMYPTMDGNYLLGGFTQNTGAVGPYFGDAWLLKIDPNGDTLWTKNYGGTAGDYINTILPTTDGNFLLAGKIHSKVGLLKVNQNGDTLWTKAFNGSVNENSYSIAPSTNGYFLLTGIADYPGNTAAINLNGDTLWTKTYGGPGQNYLHILVSTADGNFLLAGQTPPTGADRNYSGILRKITPDGDTLWTKTYVGTGYDAISTITPISDGNFLLGGNSYLSYSRSPWLQYLIDDRYTYKDSLFTFKIPYAGSDTLSCTYSPLRTPAGMTVSPGGTITWTPATDSVYMEHVEYIVINDLGRKDTLTFNIFVNSDYHPVGTITPYSIKRSATEPFEIITSSLLSGGVRFLLPVTATRIDIYDITGRQVGKLTPGRMGANACAVWPVKSGGGKKIPAGKYFARVADATGNSVVKPFLLMR